MEIKRVKNPNCAQLTANSPIEVYCHGAARGTSSSLLFLSIVRCEAAYLGNKGTASRGIPAVHCCIICYNSGANIRWLCVSVYNLTGFFYSVHRPFTNFGLYFFCYNFGWVRSMIMFRYNVDYFVFKLLYTTRTALNHTSPRN